MQLSDDIPALLVRMLGDRAGVHNEDVSSLVPRHSLESFLQKCSLIC